ncbi:MAG: 4Fe-4S dicluster domain-containing protein [Ancalomicrobiaceae bacterium]|nr:4Fe-4S dicluster domain-containing protein [Ancalomicrobiaceae bacterium]
MAYLTPLPLAVLIHRMFRELERRKAIYGLPKWRFFQPDQARDVSIDFHGVRAATPFGPAAGPHTQLAENILLAWLAGGRVIELKTVQVIDDLDIARPCIDMETVGYNIEWSQELSLEASLKEYVKAAMLIEIAKSLGLGAGAEATVFDMSIGYDLAGIRSAKVRAFLDGLKDASRIVEELKAELPDAYAHLRDLPFPTAISHTVTLSTFHGCPPDEIEAIADYLMDDVGLDVVIKLNPTLLGRERLKAILNDSLGYRDLVVPDAIFDKDATWEEVQGIVARLGARAEALDRSFGVKFSNTLLVENHRHFFPDGTKEMYLSGAPLHVLAIALVDRFRTRFGDRFPISFSAGIDAGNFADAVALGLKPVSVCSDLLKGLGYGKGADYFASLHERMAAVGAGDLEIFALKAFGEAGAALDGLELAPETVVACRAALDGGNPRHAAGGDFSRWLSATILRNTARYAEKVLADPRYAAETVLVPPERSDAELGAFDCVMCGNCVSVCPNGAVFRFNVAQEPIPEQSLVPNRYGLQVETTGTLRFANRQQIGILADICNSCGNCDVACPETGAPYALKPQFFLSETAWYAQSWRDGFRVTRLGNGLTILSRQGGDTVRMVKHDDGSLAYQGAGFDLTFPSLEALRDATGSTDGPVDLGRLRLAIRLAEAGSAEDQINFVQSALT